MEIFVQEIFTTKTFAQDYHSNDYGILILLTPVFVLLHLCAHQAIDPVWNSDRLVENTCEPENYNKLSFYML